MRKGSMHRFLMNRLWTLVFALLLGVAGASVIAGTSFADTAYGGDSGDGTGDALPVDPPPIGAGDPDSRQTAASRLPGRVHQRWAVRRTEAMAWVTPRHTGRQRSWRESRWMVDAPRAYYLRF